jgi:hypothetical protein
MVKAKLGREKPPIIVTTLTVIAVLAALIAHFVEITLIIGI